MTDMEDISLHILDIAENSVRAGAQKITIVLDIDQAKDLLTVIISDNGKGMTPEQVRQATDPFFTSKTTSKIGLGLPLLDEATKIAMGIMKIDSRTGTGTTITATFKLSHIDRKPIGNIAETLVTLIVGNPETDFIYNQKINEDRFTLNTEEFKRTLNGTAINTVDVINFIRKYLNENTTSFS